MAKVKHKVTDPAKFEKVLTIDLSGVKFTGNSFKGGVEINHDCEGFSYHEGEHGAHDFEDVFGFVLIAEEEQRPKRPSVHTGIRLDPATREALEQRAAREGRTLSNLIVNILKHSVAEYVVPDKPQTF